VEVFGTGATQTTTTITISKSALATVGLTASSDNSAEAILAAILLIAKINLTEEKFESNIDQSIVIDDGFKSTAIRGSNNVQYLTNQLTVTLAKVDPLSPLDPDDY
ncbi:MAG: hypothetical protein ACKPJO_22225, partial [Dolichospermum sp.]